MIDPRKKLRTTKEGVCMIDKDEEIKKLYRDAIYYHLLRQGCTKMEATVWVRQLCN
jgi:hypothetical protein